MAKSPQDRSISPPTLSKSPTVKEYRKFLSIVNPPFMTTDNHAYLFDEKIGILKNEDISSTALVYLTYC